MNHVIIRGDARNLPLPDNSVDLICTSPPYWQLRSYRDDGEHYDGQIGAEPAFQDYLESLWDCTREWTRVLKPDGSLFVNLGDKYGRGTRTTIHGGNSKSAYVDEGRPGNCVPTGYDKSLLGLPWRYALGCADQLGLILREEIIYDKPNSLPESVRDRCRRSHEQIFHFTRQQKYFSAVDEIRESHQSQSVARSKRRYDAGDEFSVGTPNTLNPEQFCNPLGKLPGSVWSIPSAPLRTPDSLGIDHFAAWPPDLCKKIILGWSPKEVCTKCGEGRRPVSEYTGEEGRHPGGKKREDKRTYEGPSNATLKVREITGYACACTPYTDHPGMGTGGGWGSYDGGMSGAPAASGKQHVPANYKPKTGPWREYHFDNWTPPPARPGIVLDPFGGTGTTAMVADVLGRIGITVDYSADYCRLARWRINDPRQRAMVLGIKVIIPEIPEEQLALDLDWEVS